MKPRALIVLGVVTAALVGGAYLSQRSAGPGGAAFEPRPLAPELEGAINDASRVTITRGERSLVLERREAGWVVASKDGYPAQVEAVKQVLMALARARLVEAKTSNPANFARVGVDDPPTGKGTLVKVEDGSGRALATVVLGDGAGPAGREQSVVFVRTGSPGRAYLARAEGQATLSFQPDPMSFVERTLFQVDRQRVRRVTIERPGEPPVRLLRESKEQAEPVLEGMPAGRELKYPGVVGQVAGALSFVSISDVLSAGSVDWEKDLKATARFETFDGLVVTVRSAERDGTIWSAIEASMAEGWPERAVSEAVWEARRRVEAEARAGGVEGEGPPAAAPDAGALARAEEEARAGAEAELAKLREEIESINGKTRGWAFDLSPWRAEQLTAGMEYFLRAVETPAPSPTEEPAGLPPPPAGLPLPPAGLPPPPGG